MLRVLALSPGGIGDQILFFPTLLGLKKRYPQLTLDVVVESRSQGAYEVCHAVHRAWTFNFKNDPSLGEWVDLIGGIRERNYDAILAVGRSPGVAFLLWLTGVRTRVGYNSTSIANQLLTNPVSLRQDQYAGQMYYDLLQGFGVSGTAPLPSLTLRPEDAAWAEQQILQLNLDPERLLLLHPGASALAKQKGIAKTYPAQKWATAVAQLLEKQPDYQVVVVSGPDDADLVTALQRQLGNRALFINPPSLGKLAALTARTSLLWCVDSAPMHLGVATGRRLVALFGPTDPQRLLPPDPRFVALQSKFVEQIAPQDIVQATLNLMIVA